MSAWFRWARALTLVASAFAGGALTSYRASAMSQADAPYGPFEQLARVLALVEMNYVEPTQRPKLAEGAIRGLVSELDPHSAYLPATEFALLRGETEGKYAGVGLELDFRDEIITVIAPIEGSPAARAGIQPGDEIVAIDGRAVRGERLERLIAMMRGSVGSTVTATIRRRGAREPILVSMVRAEIRVESVVFKRLVNGIAYVRVKQFQEGSHAELLRAATKLRSEEAAPLAGVVLDLRNNPGGLVDEAEAVADEFLTSGVIYTTRHRGEVVDEARAHEGGAFATLPVVAMVNEASASSTELVAGALQDNDRAVIVGTQTFGKGSVQTIFELPGGAGMRLTTMRYYTPKGRSIQAQGILPDILLTPNKPPLPGTVLRERDLAGHLPSEGRSEGGSRTVLVEQSDVQQGPSTLAAVPTDPEKGSDSALSVAYLELRRRIQEARVTR